MDNGKPKGFVKNIENIWYHYKYVILISLAALIMISVAMTQYLTKKTPDIYVYHIATSGLTAASQDDFRESMKLIAEDYNGDGTVMVEFKEEVYIPNEVRTNTNELTVSERFNLELALGDCVIYIMDKSFYLGNRDYMCNLKDVLGYLPENAYDERAVMLSDLPAYTRVPGLQDFDPESYLCLRKRRTGMDEEEYAAHVDFFKKLIEFVEWDN